MVHKGKSLRVECTQSAVGLLLATAGWHAVSASAAFAQTAPIPAINLGALVSANDYPTSALRMEAGGVVSFKVDVDAAGAVRNCAVVQSSGNVDLDTVTCQIVSSRARFKPARNARGQAVAGAYENRIRWVVPEEQVAAVANPALNLGNGTSPVSRVATKTETANPSATLANRTQIGGNASSTSGAQQGVIDAKEVAKRFGALASLVGSSWQIGTDEIVQIKWDRPGEVISIKRFGLFGPTETLVAPGATPNTLRYIRINQSFGDTLDSTAPVQKDGRFYIRATPKFRENCQKSGLSIICSRLVPSVKNWVSDVNIVSSAEKSVLLSPIDESIIPAFLSRIGSYIFPDRPEGTYNPALGMIEFASGREWFPQMPADQTDPNNPMFDLSFEVATVNGKISMSSFDPGRIGSRPILFQQGSDGVLRSRIVSSWDDSLFYRDITLVIREGGVAIMCDAASGNPRDTQRKECSEIRVSADGNKLLQRYLLDGATSLTFVPAVTIRSYQNNKLNIGLLEGKAFEGMDGLQYYFSSLKFARNNRADRDLVIYVNGKYSHSKIIDRISLINENEITLNDGGKLHRVPSIKFFAHQHFSRIAEVERTHAIVQRNDQRDREAFWSGLANDITAVSRSNRYQSNAWTGSPVITGPATTSTNAQAGMGGVFFRAPTPMTPKQRAEWEELERIKIREQLYRGQAPTSSQYSQGGGRQSSGSGSTGGYSSPRAGQQKTQAQIDAEAADFARQVNRDNPAYSTGSGTATVVVGSDPAQRGAAPAITPAPTRNDASEWEAEAARNRAWQEETNRKLQERLDQCAQSKSKTTCDGSSAKARQE